MVSKDQTDKIKIVPGLILETKEEVKNFLDAMKRKEIKDYYKNELKKLGDAKMSEEKMKESLLEERCMIVY